jgi:TonB-dependent starch-binding outer membrane protein SusC
MKLILIYFSKYFGEQSRKFPKAILLSFLLGFLTVINVTASVYSQNDKISIQADDMRLRDLLREIENNSEYAFFFNDQFPQLDTKVSFVSKNEKIENIMGRLLKDTQLDYKMLDNNFIVIVPKEASQQMVIKGKVTDANGAAIPGASILEKGTNNGAVSDIDGNFSIKVQSNESILVISFLGYVSEEVAVGNQTDISVTLAENIETLNEVVVVGYGSMQRSNVTGSISSVKAEDLQKSPTPNAIEALRGMVPGVRITRNSGQPGADVDITVRSVKSLGTVISTSAPG